MCQRIMYGQQAPCSLLHIVERVLLPYLRVKVLFWVMKPQENLGHHHISHVVRSATELMRRGPCKTMHSRGAVGPFGQKLERACVSCLRCTYSCHMPGAGSYTNSIATIRAATRGLMAIDRATTPDEHSPTDVTTDPSSQKWTLLHTEVGSAVVVRTTYISVVHFHNVPNPLAVVMVGGSSAILTLHVAFAGPALPIPVKAHEYVVLGQNNAEPVRGRRGSHPSRARVTLTVLD